MKFIVYSILKKGNITKNTVMSYKSIDMTTNNYNEEVMLYK